jgi:hypothetical protein
MQTLGKQGLASGGAFSWVRHRLEPGAEHAGRSADLRPERKYPDPYAKEKPTWAKRHHGHEYGDHDR